MKLPNPDVAFFESRLIPYFIAKVFLYVVGGEAGRHCNSGSAGGSQC